MVKRHINFIFWTATGAALGAMLREGILYYFDTSSPWMLIAIINMVGTFVIAVVYEVEHRLHENITIFATIGLCGGFTTFSHFTHRTVSMIMAGDYLTPIANILISLIGTFAAGYIGIVFIKFLRRLKNRLQGAV